MLLLKTKTKQLRFYDMELSILSITSKLGRKHTVKWSTLIVSLLGQKYASYVHIVKTMVFPVVTDGCESWTVRKAELMLLNCGAREDS